MMGKSICLVTVELEGLDVNGGIGSYYDQTAKLLSKNGWDVVVLYFSLSGTSVGDFAKSYYRDYGIRIFDAGQLCKEQFAEHFQDMWKNCEPSMARSHVFHEALNILMSKYGFSFDLIEFPDWTGPGFVAVNMKKNLKEYSQSQIIVKLHGPSQWTSDACGQEYWDIADIKQFYMERYSFDNADIQASQTFHLLKWCGEHGWKVRNDASVGRTPLSLGFERQTNSDPGKRKEIIYFGRFEERKGINDFIEALKLIESASPEFSHEYAITFLGKESITKDHIAESLPGFTCRFLTLPRAEAIQYLLDNARLAVIPSRLDNLPNTVSECMYAKIPFITTRAGGIPEIIGDNGEICCNPEDPADLAKKIIAHLAFEDEQKQTLIDKCHERIKDFISPEKILRWYDDQLTCRQQPGNIRDMPGRPEQPGVTILIPTRNENTSKYLETTLKSLFDQTYGNIKIIVNDSSTEQHAITVLEELIKRYPDVKFFHRDNNGIGNALNLVLPYVTTKYVMQVDADNMARPEMVDTFVRCMENRKDIAGLSCYHSAFVDADEENVLRTLKDTTAAYKPRFFYKPIGPCLPILFFENCQGDANSIFLTGVMKSIGGWLDEARKGTHDWGTWLKLISKGYDVDVVRKALFYYRVRPNSSLGSKRLFNKDKFNYEQIRVLINERPDFFYRYCFEGMHRLVRRTSFTRRSISEDELLQIKSSTLFMVGKTLGDMAKKSPAIKKVLEVSGESIKKALGKN